MQEQRLKILLEYLAEEPNEPFNVYAVAMEYMNTDAKKALVYLQELLEKHPNYLPSYYHAANLMAELEMEQAQEVFEKGIALAKQQGNEKAARELKSAHDMHFFC